MRPRGFACGVVLAASAACSPAERGPDLRVVAAIPAPAPAPTLAHPVVEPTRDAAGAPVEPEVDFTTLAEMESAGVAAIGKRGRLQMRRDHYTSSKDFTAVDCGGKRRSMHLSFPPALRDYVRAMLTAPGDSCATVTFTIAGVDKRIMYFDGTLERVGGVVPKSPRPAPPGADYASIDDVLLDGDASNNKIVASSFWAYTSDPKRPWLNDCGVPGSFAFVFTVPKTPDQRALASKISTTPGQCTEARLRVVEPGYGEHASDGSIMRPRVEIVGVP